MMTPRPIFSKRNITKGKRKTQGRRLKRSPQLLVPMFVRVFDAKGYASTCAAIYRAARELLRRRHSFHNVTHDLSNMRPDMGLIVAEIVLAAKIVLATEKGGHA